MGQEVNRGEVRGAKTEGMQTLHQRRYQKRRLERHQPPADRRGQGSDGEQSRGTESCDQGPGEGEQHDFDNDTEGPERSDRLR